MVGTRANIFLLCVFLGIDIFACAQDDLEPDDTHERATPLIVGDFPTSHTFHDESDPDWSVVYLLKNKIYSIHVENVGPSADIVLEVNASSSISLIMSIDEGIEGDDETAILNAGYTGYHYVLTKNFIPSVFGSGTSYTIKAVLDAAPNLGLVFFSGPDYLDIEWPESAEPGVTAYSIRRSTSFMGTYAEIDTVPAGTTAYHDTNLLSETTYYYRVHALAPAEVDQTGIFQGTTTEAQQQDPQAGAYHWYLYR